MNKAYFQQLLTNIQNADPESKKKWLVVLKRELLDNVGSGTLVGEIKDPGLMGERLKQIGMEDADINHIVGAMSEDSEHSNAYHESDIILITGQTGIGKTHQAKKLHQQANPEGKFITISGAALKPEFHGAELFGVEKGAYTGANEDKDGAFVAAGDGTLFIDELQSLSPEVQGMLNVALDEQAVTKVGPSSIKVPYNCKLVLASNEDLEELVDNGRFRGDLYSRLTGPEAYHIDISDLDADRIAEVANQETDRLGINLGPGALSLLQRIDYEYGIRELKKILRIAYRAAKADGSKTINPEHFQNEKVGLEKKADEVQEHFAKYDPETMRYLAKNYTGDSDMFPQDRIQRDRIVQVFEQLGGDPQKMSEWLQKGSLGLVTKHLEAANDLSTKSISAALKSVMSDFSVAEDDIVKGMRLVSNLLECTEDDPFTSLLPEDHELEEMDQRVLEAMDNTILMADEDIIGIANKL